MVVLVSNVITLKIPITSMHVNFFLVKIYVIFFLCMMVRGGVSLSNPRNSADVTACFCAPPGVGIAWVV